MNKVRRVLINLIRATIPPGISGSVVSVNEEEFTCVVKPFDGGANYEEVRLKTTVDGAEDGMVSIPEINSDVLILPLYNNQHVYFVARFSKVKKWFLKTVSGAMMELDENGIVKLMGDDFGGIPKVEAVQEKINALEQDLNTLKQLFTGWVPVASDGGAALKTATSAWAGNTISPTTKTELENTKVKHGQGN